jgi:drug/metabolite transporter (DMT)-like permease
MKSQIKADLALLLVTMLWGTSYLLTDFVLEELDPFNINALRFIIAFLAAVLLTGKKLRPTNIVTLKYTALLGAILMVVYLGSTFGVKYTSLSNAGFLCALTVVITPVLGFFFKGQRAEKKLIASVVFAIIKPCRTNDNYNE